MAGIFDSPITMGLIQGSIDTLAAGRIATREKARLEKEAEAKATLDSQGQLFDYLVKKDNYGQANIFLDSPLFYKFRPEQQQAIFLNATRTDQPLPQNLQSVFDGLSSDRQLATEVMSVYSALSTFDTSHLKMDGGSNQEVDALIPSIFAEKNIDLARNVTGMPVTENTLALVEQVASLPKSYRTMLQASATSTKLSENQLKIINGLPKDDLANRKDMARQYINTATPGTMFHTLLTNAINADIPAKPYERLDNQVLERLEKSLIPAGDGPLREDLIDQNLRIVDSLIDNIKRTYVTTDGKGTYTGSPDAVLDLHLLTALKQSYATQEGTLAKESTAADIITIINDGADRLKDFGDDDIGRKIQLSENVIGSIAKLAGVDEIKDADPAKTGFQINPELNIPPEATAAFLTLIEARSLVEKVDSNASVFKSGNKNIRIETEDSIEKEPTNFLVELNRRIGSLTYEEGADKGLSFFTGMDAEQKAEFEQKIITALGLDHEEQITASFTGEFKKEAQGPRDYSQFLPHLYELPFVKAHVHDNLGISKPDETLTGRPANATPQVDINGGPLSEDQYAFTPGMVMNVPEEVKSLATRAGTDVHKFISNSDLHFRMIDSSNYSDPFYLFKPASVIANMGFFTNSVDAPVDSKDAARIGQVFMRFGITDRNDQLDVLSVAMSGDLPSGFGTAKGRTTMTLPQSNALIERLTGVPTDEKKLASRMAADKDFLATSKQVLRGLEAAPEGSAFTTGVQVIFSNLFLTQDGVAQKAVEVGGKALEVLGLYDPDDYEDAAQQLRIEDATEAFLRQDFLQNDAVLASNLVKLAYNFAKTMDEAGRISERDYLAALQAVNADFLANKGTRVAVVNNLIKRAQDGVIRHNRLFEQRISLREGSRFNSPTRDQIKQLRALRYFSDVVDVTDGMSRVDVFEKHMSKAGFAGNIMAATNDPVFKEMYDIKFAISTFGDVARDQNIYRVKRKPFGSKTSVDFVRGVPMYVDSEGNLLSQERIRELLQMGQATTP